MPDIYGITNALAGCMEIYFRSARGSGRTTELVNLVQEGDRVIFVGTREATRFLRLCRERGITGIDTMVTTPGNPQAIFQRPTATGRVFFDHSWVEEFHRAELQRAGKLLEMLARESSGTGEAHHETHLAARETIRWQR